MESFSGLLRAVMNHTDTCILVCDAETQEILYATDTIKEFIPETEAEALIGKNCQELFDKCPEWRGFRFADKIRSGKEYDLEEYFEHRKKVLLGNYTHVGCISVCPRNVPAQPFAE